MSYAWARARRGCCSRPTRLLPKPRRAFGVVIKLAAFPAGATLDSVEPQVVERLGLFSALVTLLFGVGMALGFLPYRLTRERHAAIVHKLRQVRDSA